MTNPDMFDPDTPEIASSDAMRANRSEKAAGPVLLTEIAHARFGIGEIVRHRLFPFRGVVFDVDAQFANTEEWWDAIPEHLRPDKDQPFYHLLAENDEDAAYIAYVSQQNLEREERAQPVHHPAVNQLFDSFRDGRYVLRSVSRQ